MNREIKYGIDGDMITAFYNDFINLQESNCGFGKTKEEALENLIFEDEIQKILNKAKEFNIEIYPYQMARYKLTRKQHLMPDNMLNNLSKEQMDKYLNALYRIHNDNAGGFNGWSGAMDIFLELGATKSEVSKGHRTFTSISF